MSLLLEALQKASKDNLGEVPKDGQTDDEISTQTPTVDGMTDHLALEPVDGSQPDPESDPDPEPEEVQTNAPPASPEYAAEVMQANDAGKYTIIDWVRDHHMLSFLACAVLFAIGYGLYVYIQVSNPSWLRPSPPQATQPLSSGAVQAPIAQLDQPARISGLPVTGTSGQDAGGITVTETKPDSPSNAVTERQQIVPAAPAPEIRESAPSETSQARQVPSAPVKRETSAPRQEPQPAPVRQLDTSDDEIEVVDIPASPAFSNVPEEDNAGPRISVLQGNNAISQIDSMLLRAYDAMQSGRQNSAESLYAQVLMRDPDNIDALLGQAAIAWAQGRTDFASQHYGRVLELQPRNSYAQAGLIALLGKADPIAAESKLKQLIGRDPSGFLYFTLGNLYAEQGKWSRAQDAYFQAYQYQPDNSDYAFNLAVGLEHLGQTRPALQYYRIALDLSFAKGHANFDQSLAIERVGQLSARVD